MWHHILSAIAYRLGKKSHFLLTFTGKGLQYTKIWKLRGGNYGRPYVDDRAKAKEPLTLFPRTKPHLGKRKQKLRDINYKCKTNGDKKEGNKKILLGVGEEKESGNLREYETVSF